MKEKLLHTPEGVRDIYNWECKRKHTVEKELQSVLSLYGYQEIETPTFEFFDIFNSDTGTVSSREMYKFFDRNNNTLVLRPDMTPSIARSVAKYYFDCDHPLRLSYKGNTYVNTLRYQGKLSEKTELGAELINDDSPQADAESIVMMIDCFLAAGLTDFQIEIGQAEFYKGIMAALDVSDEIKSQIHEYIENKNALGMEMLLEDLNIKNCYRNILLEYNELYGDASMLARAKELTTNPRCLGAIVRLEQVYEVLCQYGYEKYVSFDLGMVNHYDYYTGIIFRGYTYGIGDAIGKGGRYDNLLKQFGKNSPACGFTILVDDLLSALSRQNIAVPVSDYDYQVVLSQKKDNAKAISLVNEMRKKGEKTEWISMNIGKTVEEYLDFTISQGAQRIFVLTDEGIIQYNREKKMVSKTPEEEGSEGA